MAAEKFPGVVVEITSVVVSPSGVSRKDGKPYPAKQEAWLYNGRPFPVELRVSLGLDNAERGTKSRDAYLPGRYTLAPSCYRSNDFGMPELNRYDIELIRLPDRYQG